MASPATPLWFGAARAGARLGVRPLGAPGHPPPGAPLLDVGLFRKYRATLGIVLGSTVLLGFAGVWPVLALYLQDGLGYSPLQSGLTVMPFAIGSAVASITAGRLVARWGRWVTVTGLSLVVTGFALISSSPLTSPDYQAPGCSCRWRSPGRRGRAISPNIT